MKIVKTELKLFSIVLRFLLILLGIFLLTLSYFNLKELQDNVGKVPQTLLPFFMGYFCLGMGLTSLVAYSIDNQKIIKQTLFLFKKEIEIGKIASYNIREVPGTFATSNLIILNKRDGKTIFIDSFDYNNFEEFRSAVEKVIQPDERAKANYWTQFMKLSITLLVLCLVILLISVMAGK